jgi:Zn-finger nucleic acid-binding protein
MELTGPKCQGTMRSYERSGITVDLCTECRGVFLDRGELERLVDADTAFHTDAQVGLRSAAPAVPPPTPRYGTPVIPRYQPDQDDDDRYRDGRYREGRYDDHYEPRRRKKRSFLEDLFD